jgi:protein-S-isoprenylcysteine O-methyltransferase Ste14
MDGERILDLTPVVALAVIGIVAFARMAALGRRGVRVVVVDPQRPGGEMAFDSVVVAVFLFWVYLIVDFADGDGLHWAPVWLGRELLDLTSVKWLGAALLAIGVTLYALAVAAMGDSWRMGIDRAAHSPSPLKGGVRGGIVDASEKPAVDSVVQLSWPPLSQPLPSGERGSNATLITSGVFAWSRNPIYLAFDLIVSGSLAIHGLVAFLVAALMLTLLLHMQILREERFLDERYGDEFREYCRRVGRYGPWG